ncbi:hypothetical protein WJX72_011542 [[Myrmecia] bisecta]|uniref:beta-fructofuranosidase n=1 Tax=[Myrmecia] bisecta TaxID=41462 RepID=A0AAW1PB47_9CHLO
MQLTRKQSGSRGDLGDSWQLDSDKPWFHVLPREGWLNDPNGPIFYKGRYHIFYQHISGTSEWEWRMCWGHASSADLVHWEHEPIAIEPSASGYDASGCWSGNTTLDEKGVPTMLYTGVRLRGEPDHLLPPQAVDLGLQMIETQCCARCDPDDTRLVSWAKLDKPAIHFPPPGMALEGWRDPFVFQRGGAGREWRLVLGSGVKGRGGTLLVYKSQDAAQGWEYAGELTTGKSRPLLDFDLGAMWECPFFTPLNAKVEADAQPSAAGPSDGQAPPASGAAPSSNSAEEIHMLCVSPYPHHRTDRPTNPCLYWLGQYRNEAFDLEAAQGPYLLDLGDVLYAPNSFRDASGRTLMLAWLQELRKGGGFDYAGCLSLPRVLALRDGVLHQEPAPELAQLRCGASGTAAHLEVPTDKATRVPLVNAPSVDVTFTLERGQSQQAGVLLRPWLHIEKGGAACAAAVVVDWDRSVMEVVFPSKLDASCRTFRDQDVIKRIGGPIRLDSARQSVRMRVLMDHSVLEAFLDSGEVLTTRVYRHDPHGERDKGLYLVALGGAAVVRDLEAHEMGSIWLRPEDQPVRAE